MIDYEKLKEAHELADKYAKDNKQAVYISIGHYTYEDMPCNFRLTIYDWFDEIYKDIDDLITNLKKLTKTEPKYKVGQKAACLHREEIIEFTIEKVELQGKEFWYSFRHDEHQVNRFIESILYPSREALIDAQIEYWQKQLCICDREVKINCPFPHDKHFNDETVKVRGEERPLDGFVCAHEATDQFFYVRHQNTNANTAESFIDEHA